MADASTFYLGDNPITSPNDDWLGRRVHAETIAELIDQPSLAVPLTVGVYGDWGSGKTSLLRLIEKQLLGKDKYLVVWFNAWAYSRQPYALWRAMLLALVDALRNRKDDLLNDRERMCRSNKTPFRRDDERRLLEQRLEQLETSLYRSQVSRKLEGHVNWQAALVAAAVVARSAMRLLSGGAVVEALEDVLGKENVKNFFDIVKKREQEEVIEQVRSLEQFRREFAGVVRKYINELGWRLIVLIDDLDRCLPEHAVGVLEALKIFFDADDGEALNLVFVLGMDRRIIERGIRTRYANFALSDRPGLQPVDSAEYLDKIVQVPYSIPPLNSDQIQEYAWNWCRAYQKAKKAAAGDHKGIERDPLASVIPLIAAGVAPNPRSVKRTLLSLSLIRDARSKMGLSTDPETLKLLAKLVIIQMNYEPIFREIARQPALLRDLEQDANKEQAHHDGIPRSPKPEEVPELLRNDRKALLAHVPRLCNLLKTSPRFPSDFNQTRSLLESLLYFQVH